MTIKNLREITDGTVVLHSVAITYVDVDETLIFWEAKDIDADDCVIEVTDPYINGTRVKVVPHWRNIRLLQRKFGQGHKIVVWSAGGSEWAETIVKALKIEPFVHLILSKPTHIIDDKEMKDWGVPRIYLPKHFDQHAAEKSSHDK